MTRLQKFSPLLSRKRKKEPPILKGFFLVTSDGKMIITSDNEKIIVNTEPAIEINKE